MKIAHVSDRRPRTLPNTWTDPSTGKTHVSMRAYSLTKLAELGWYEVVRAPLNTGAAGYEPLEESDLDLQAGEAGQWLQRSKPANHAVVNRQNWARDKQARERRAAQKILAQPPSANPTGDEVQARLNAIQTLQGI